MAWGAIRRFKSNGKVLSWKDAFAFAIDALNIKEHLSKGVVNFSFAKVDTGEVREAKGTLELSAIPAELHPKGTGKHPETTNTVKYYDLDKQGWRSFDIANLIPLLV